VLGNERGEHVSVLATRREFPEALAYWDVNWVCATVRIRVGAFYAEYEALRVSRAGLSNNQTCSG
jgi:hypothetical protein